uniref:Uncharacterized protein n=1 Tax=Steinernema glaseri TaxID=37863 RepID=A0A1I8AP88_9BILA
MGSPTPCPQEEALRFALFRKRIKHMEEVNEVTDGEFLNRWWAANVTQLSDFITGSDKVEVEHSEKLDHLKISLPKKIEDLSRRLTCNSISVSTWKRYWKLCWRSLWKTDFVNKMSASSGIRRTPVELGPCFLAF